MATVHTPSSTYTLLRLEYLRLEDFEAGGSRLGTVLVLEDVPRLGARSSELGEA